MGLALRGVGSFVAIAFSTMSGALADEPRFSKDFEQPYRLVADGKVIDHGGYLGHAAPCVVDLNGDGLKDLIVGDFNGDFKIYTNVGTSTAPKFKADGKVQAGGKDAQVRIYCCIGSQARFCDLDADGIQDMISNSYDPGHCYLFRGVGAKSGQMNFAAPIEIVDKSGTPVRTYPIQKQEYQSFGSFYDTVDWDNDGDLDLLIGTFEGPLKVRINEGTAQKAEFATTNTDVQADGEALKVKGHFCPRVIDWNGDGLWDIIAGSEDGSVSFFRNIGKLGRPQFAKAELLVNANPGNGYDIIQWSDNNLIPGIRSQVEVTDFNGDGKLDILLGDFSTAYDIRTNLTSAEKDEFNKLVVANQLVTKGLGDKLEALRADFKKRFPGDAIYSEEADKLWDEEYKQLKDTPEFKNIEQHEKQFVKHIRPFLASTEREGDTSFDMAKPHGYVWVYLHK